MNSFQVFTAVERNEESELGPGVEQVLVTWIFANDVDVADCRQIAGD